MTTTQNTAFLKRSNLNTPSSEIEKEFSVKGSVAFYSIIDERLKKFGLGKNLKKEITLSLALIAQYHRYIKTGDVFLLNTINILKAQLEALKQSDESEGDEDENTFLDELAIMYEKYGSFDTKEKTIAQYETMKKGLINSFKRDK